MVLPVLPGSSSSLKRLQSLEQDYGDFPTQLVNLAKILGISSERRLATLYAITADGRLDWALRWLLTKLRDLDEAGIQARSSVQAWRLLCDIFERLLPSMIARALISAKFLSIVEDTAKEALINRHSADQVENQHNGKIKNGDLEDLLPVVKSNDETPIAIAKKRKRGKDMDSSTAPRKRRAVENEKSSTLLKVSSPIETSRDIFPALDACLYKLVAIASHKSTASDDHSRQYIHSTLKTDVAQAARLVGCWLHLESLKVSSSVLEGHRSTTGGGLFNVLYIWGISSVASENPTENLAVGVEQSFEAPIYANKGQLEFSQHCLVPAARFLIVRRQQNPTSSSDSAEQNAVFEVERLLAQHIFEPCKAKLRQTSQRVGSGHGTDVAKGISISNLLKPIRERLSKKESGSDRKALLVDVAAIPILFDIAIRCSHLINPKKRMIESPWIEAVFLALTSCLGVDVSDEDLQDVPKEFHQAFEHLLQLVMQNKIVFKGDFISKTALKLMESESFATIDIHWAILSRLLALDPDAFMPPRFVTEMESHLDRTSLNARFLDAITAQAWIPCNISPHLHATEGSTDLPHQRYCRFLHIRDEVVIPLTKAYISARDLRGFLVQWQEQLEHALDESLKTEDHALSEPSRKYRFSVWQDQVIDQQVAQHIGNTFTTRQIFDLTKRFATGLDSDISDSPERFEVARATSNLHILCAIYNGLPHDMMETSLQGMILDHHQRCISILQLTQTKEHSIRSVVWRLLAICHRMIFALVEFPTIRSQMDIYQAIVSQAVASIDSAGSSTHWDRTDQGLEALDCLGSLSKDFRERHLSEHTLLIPTPELLDSLHKIMVNDKSETDVTKRFRFASVLLKYPGLLDTREHEDANQKRIRIALLESVGRTLLNSMDVDDTNLWQSFVQRAQDEATNLVEDIVKASTDTSKPSNIPSNKDRDVFDEAFLEIRPNLIYRPTRQQILDEAISKLDNRNTPHDALTWSRTLGIMLRLLETPTGSAVITRSSECLWNLAVTLDGAIVSSQINADNIASILTLFKEVAGVVLHYHASNVNGAQNQQYLQELWAKIKAWSKGSDLLQIQPAVLGVYVLLCDVLSTSEDVRRNIGEEDDGITEELCSKLCSELDGQLVQLSSINPKFLPAMVLLDALSNLNSFMLDRNVEIVDRTVDAWTSQVLVPKYLHDKKNNSALATLVFKARSKLNVAKDVAPNLSHVVLLSLQELASPDRQLLHQAFLESLQPLTDDTKNNVIEDLITVGADQAMDAAKLDLLHSLVLATKYKHYTALIPAISIPLITTTVFEGLDRAPSYDSFHKQSAVLIHLLLHRAKEQNQFTIDTAILTLITICSPSGPHLSKSNARHIFSALTRILLALFTHHRRALRGRFDLLMLALQSLLRCLFIPLPSYTTTTTTNNTANSSLRHHLPPWAATTPATALTATHATAYSRLLTTLCDPTIASVRSRSSNLTDATKKARGYAGQYAPLVLEELCRCLLVGRLGGEGSVRDALLPGVWAVFAVVERGALMAVSDGMPAGERSVLRGLREEWRRVGGAREGKRG